MKVLFFCCLLVVSFFCFSQEKCMEGTWRGEFSIPSPFQGIRVLELPDEDISFPLIFNIENRDGGYKVVVHDPDNRSLNQVVSFFVEDSTAIVKMEGKRLQFSGRLVHDTLLEGNCTYLSFSRPFRLVKQREAVLFQRPQEPRPPFPYVEEQLNIKSMNDPGISMACTFSYPAESRKLPAVILVPGTGAIDRDGTIAYHKLFYVIADYLNRNGFAVIRYDKRGVGKSSGVYDGGTIEELTTDVESVFEFLKCRKEVDPKRIGFLGHSMGGGIAYSAAAGLNDAAFVISLGTPGISGEEHLYEQRERLLRSAHLPERLIAANSKLMKELVAVSRVYSTDFVMQHLDSLSKTFLPDSLKNSSKDIRFISGNLLAFCNPLNKSGIEYDPAESLCKLKCPVLVLNGEKDYVVDCVHAEKIGAVLKKSGNNKVTVKTYPHLNHLFQTCQTGSLQEYIWIEETVSPKVLKDILSWLERVVK